MPVTSSAVDAAVAALAHAAEPLPRPEDGAFGASFDRFADKRVVLLGECSHGTSEFYRARAAITRRLVEAHGFSIVAVEADWPDAATIDRWVRHRPPRPGAEPPFQRFPTWMWRNEEVHAFARWLREHNGAIADPRRRAGFYGLDLYSMGASIRAVLDYLDRVDPDAAQAARERYGCLERWHDDPARYGLAALHSGQRTCEKAVLTQLGELLARRLGAEGEGEGDGDLFLDAAQNARLVAAAERYYRVMYYRSEASWNLRDTHMFETLGHLLDARGPSARAVVWAHNSHIGDAAETDMGRQRGEINIGDLCRRRFGDEAALIGMGTHAGTVAAASDWDAPMEVMRVRESRPGSCERLCHDSGIERFLIDLRAGRLDADDRQTLAAPRLQRFIGVIYRPETELQSHYAEVSLAGQFDAYLWFDESRAVTPLPAAPPASGPGSAETYPFGL
jgi:erythromycin esterase-like protein